MVADEQALFLLRPSLTPLTYNLELDQRTSPLPFLVVPIAIKRGGKKDIKEKHTLLVILVIKYLYTPVAFEI